MTDPRPLFEALNSPAPDHFEVSEIQVTQAHRERAAVALHEIGLVVQHWIATGNNSDGALNDQLVDLANAFANFEHELLLCPSIVVHGMEESEDVCSNCGTSAEDFHTIRDCFAKYKVAQDDAAGLVLHDLQCRIDVLTAERNEAREGYHQIDSNWAAIHEGAMGPIRSALDLPDGSVLEIVTAIEALKQGHTNPHTCVAIGVNGERYCSVCGKGMPDLLPLHVFWDEDCIYIVARDCEDAELVYARHTGGVDPTFDTLQFSRCPDEQEISIRVWLSGRSAMQIAPADEAESDAIGVCKQTARAWAEQQPRGFLCTTDF